MTTGDAPRSARAEPLYGERTGQTWALLQEQTDVQLDPFGRAVLATLAPARAARVLDVGCGCGQTVLELAEIVGPRGHVVGVDISAPMLARARERCPALPGGDLCRADAQTHPFAPGLFDAVFSRFGVMFFADARLAFANLHRALRPDGRLASSTSRSSVATDRCMWAAR